LSLPPASRHPVHASDVSSTVPIDARLIGAQLVGLAVLAGAVTIAVARLSLRRKAALAAAAAAGVAGSAGASPDTGGGSEPRKA
jgi:hypothetical protein